MRRILWTLLLGILFVSSETAAWGADSRVPSYLILRAPARTPHGQPYYPGRGYEVKPQAYAYGWFGVSSRSHWRRHEGYSSSYIQWSKQ